MPDPDNAATSRDGLTGPSETDFSTTEGDVSGDDATVTSRTGGGDDQPDMADRDSTTGTTPNSEFVGRVAGADATDTGESGAEARAAVGDTGPA